MYLLAKIALIVGLGLSLYFGFELYLLSRGTSEPQLMAVAELGRRGALANVHVTITDFQPAEKCLIETENDRWVRAWVPLFMPDRKWTERPVLAYVTSVQNDAELFARIGRGQLTGVVTNGLQGFGSKQQGEIAPAYPNVVLSDAIAFNVGRSFPRPVVAIPLFLLGLVLLFGGGGISFGLIRVNHS